MNSVLKKVKKNVRNGVIAVGRKRSLWNHGFSTENRELERENDIIDFRNFSLIYI